MLRQKPTLVNTEDPKEKSAHSLNCKFSFKVCFKSIFIEFLYASFKKIEKTLHI